MYKLMSVALIAMMMTTTMGCAASTDRAEGHAACEDRIVACRRDAARKRGLRGRHDQQRNDVSDRITQREPEEQGDRYRHQQFTDRTPSDVV